MAKKKAVKKKTTPPVTTKKATKKAVTLTDVYNQVAVMADTEGVKINVAETKRVLACFFDVLEDYKPADAFDIVAKGLKRAGGRRR
ncbi:hypothetical protein NHH03_04435 [Stieleria sp. TO1_6]|uniref:hypothetical protein n=1 Tax=Stieleria tagensis TaxID=2956795 RepID=UPI00209A6790|nr:hypothetical protein [Stieleria tagensis]MCO8120975.1 hypothetical protein [Stieleria tagensis]